MSKERFYRYSQQKDTSKVPFLAKAVTLSLPISALFPHDSVDSNPPLTPPEHIQTVQGEEKNNTFETIVEDDKVQIALGLTSVYGALSIASAYKLGKKYDEKIMRIARITPPALLTATSVTALGESFSSIDRTIPASLFMAFTFAQGAHSIANTYQHELDPQKKALAVASAGALSSIGVTTFWMIQSL